MIDIAETQPDSGFASGRLAAWYLRSTGERDTHVGVLEAGAVLALCGVQFTPLRALCDRGPALPGYPPDPDQICPDCYRAGGVR